MPQRLQRTEADRLERLSRLGRRCDSSNRTCVQTAVDRLTIRDVDPETGEPTSEPREVLSCSKHRRVYFRAAEIEITDTVYLGPVQTVGEVVPVEVDWQPHPEPNTYTAQVRGVTWYLSLLDDGVLPPGWRVWRDGQRHPTAVAAAGRPLDIVMDGATRRVNAARTT